MSRPTLHLPGGLQQALANGQVQQMQMNQVFLQTASETMSKLVSTSYIDSLNISRQNKLLEIKKKIKEEHEFIEEELNRMCMEEFAKDGNIQININFGLLAQIAIQSGQALLYTLQQGK